MHARARSLLVAAVVLCGAGLGRAQDRPVLKAEWEMPPRCAPFDPPRVKDLKEELRQTGYRLAIALHPAGGDAAPGGYPPRDLFIINADGTGLKQLTDTPDKDECVPRTSPDGKWFTHNYGDTLVDLRTLKTRQLGGGYVWAPDSRRTVECGKNGLVYTDIETGQRSKPVRVERRVSITDLTCDGKWFIFEIRDYQGSQYTIDFMSAEGGPIHKMPNHPVKAGECHPAFSPDGQWMCWNSGESLSVRRFDPALPGGTDGKIVTLPKEKIGQDPCGRWSHCGRYIAYTNIPHQGSWKVHSPICIVRLADAETITISPPGWLGHHWDYDWLPPE
jgi:Tol biopolymer transport system component